MNCCLSELSRKFLVISNSQTSCSVMPTFENNINIRSLMNVCNLLNFGHQYYIRFLYSICCLQRHLVKENTTIINFVDTPQETDGIICQCVWVLIFIKKLK